MKQSAKGIILCVKARMKLIGWQGKNAQYNFRSTRVQRCLDAGDGGEGDRTVRHNKVMKG